MRKDRVNALIAANHHPMVYVPGGPTLCLNDQGGTVMSVTIDKTATLRAETHAHEPVILDMTHACDVIRECGGVSPTLNSRMGTGGNQVPLTSAKQSHGEYVESDVASTECARQGKDATDCITENMTVRRLTPLECERLQGFPDGWTDIGEWTDEKGKKHESSDTARYKALGNSIALPPWKWVLKRISAQYERDATLGSLFDGIGGFPLIWERLNGEGTCLWASEIEPFCISVTEKRFGCEDNSDTD